MDYGDEKLKQRFWKKVDKSGECWVWLGRCNPYGGFDITMGSHKHSSTQRAHRVSWKITYGDIPSEVQVLHHCDNPPCVRPDHLFTGDRFLNMRDKTLKGRHHSAKITPDEAAEIRTSKATAAELHERFGIGLIQISRIRRGLRWQCLTTEGLTTCQ